MKRLRHAGRLRGARASCRRDILLALLALISPGIVVDVSYATGTIAEVLAVTPFTDTDRAQVMAGKIVVTGVTEVSERELAVGAACLIPGDTTRVLEPFRTSKPLVPQEFLREFGEIRPKTERQALQRASLGPAAAPEARRYVRAQPGFDLNLSAQEIAAFNALDGSGQGHAQVEQVQEALRHMLLARYRAYREKGLRGIPAYERGTATFMRPHEELLATMHGSKPLKTLFPEFHRAWLEYPQAVPPHSQETFFWSRVEIDNRPAFILSHRLDVTAGEAQLIGERNFYTSRFFDVAQTVVGRYPVKEGALFAYAHRVWVDRWSGFSSIKRKLGRKLIASRIQRLVQGLRICDR